MSSPSDTQPETVRPEPAMEAVQGLQTVAEDSLARLQSLTRNLDAIVRDEIRRTLVDELGGLTAVANRASSTLESICATSSLRCAVFGFVMTSISAGLPMAIGLWTLPSPAQVDELRARRTQLSQDIQELRRQGAEIELRHCGQARRLCARVEREAPAFGPQADYLILKGY